MSEDVRADQRFGHIVLQTEMGEVLTLELFETPDLVCRGFYLPLPTSIRPPAFERPERPPLPLPEVELVARRQALDELRSTTEINERVGEDGIWEFTVYGRGFEGSGTALLVSEDREQGTETWTGRVAGAGPALSPGTVSGEPEATFVLERYGSPELIAVILAVVLMIYRDMRADILDERCYRRAVENCGERGIAHYRNKHTWTSLIKPGGGDHECEWDCQ